MTQRKTVVSIDRDAFLINGEPTYRGRRHRGRKVEGLLLNARMVQGIFDDLNPATRSRWDYPDGPWDAERNTDELIAAMPSWHAAGLRAFTLNLQGGSPRATASSSPGTTRRLPRTARCAPTISAGSRACSTPPMISAWP